VAVTSEGEAPFWTFIVEYVPLPRRVHPMPVVDAALDEAGCFVLAHGT
jgi:hypothetical protein